MNKKYFKFSARLNFRLLVLLIVLSGMLFSAGCASMFSSSTDAPSRKKLPSKEAVNINLTVSRAELKIALGDEYKTSKLRAVEVFQNTSGAVNGMPVYRLFEVENESVYALLGLKEADILVAINERTVAAPHVIGQVVRLLSNEKSIQFEVLRGGKSYLINTKFTN